MELIPAIDILGGKCVRLKQGDYNQSDVFGDDPLLFALRWAKEGAARLHLVDLDGARDGHPVNTAVIKRICNEVTIPVQLGGGIRDEKTADEALALGLDRVVIGTSFARDLALARRMLPTYGERIAVGLDARDGNVAVSGWTEDTTLSAIDFACTMAAAGAHRIVYTDIVRDGMLGGPNLDAMAAMADAVGIPVVASGGVGSVADLFALQGLGRQNLEGVIIGRALYGGHLNLSEAIIAVKGK